MSQGDTRSLGCSSYGRVPSTFFLKVWYVYTKVMPAVGLSSGKWNFYANSL